MWRQRNANINKYLFIRVYIFKCIKLVTVTQPQLCCTQHHHYNSSRAVLYRTVPNTTTRTTAVLYRAVSSITTTTTANCTAQYPTPPLTQHWFAERAGRGAVRCAGGHPSCVPPHRRGGDLLLPPLPSLRIHATGEVPATQDFSTKK